MKSALHVTFSVLALAWASGAQAQNRVPATVRTQISPPHVVAVGDLIGLTPAQVQRRLTGLDADWPRTPGLEVETDRGVLSFAAIDDYLRDPAAAELEARARTRDGHLPGTWSACSVDNAPGLGGSALLMFRDDRLERIWSQPARRRDDAARPEPGALPLVDGAAFLTRWDRTPVDAGARLTVRCDRRDAVTRAVPARPRRLSASDMQGLALLPSAPALPVMNGVRAAHQRSGPALYARLAPGYRPPEGTRALASGRGVKALHGRDPAYVVLRIDLGGYSTRNLSNTEDFALVGVRDGVVAWRALEYSRAAQHLPTGERGLSAVVDNRSQPR